MTKWFEQERAIVRDPGFDAHYVIPRNLAGFERAFASIANWGADSPAVPDTPLTAVAGRQIIEFA